MEYKYIYIYMCVYISVERHPIGTAGTCLPRHRLALAAVARRYRFVSFATFRGGGVFLCALVGHARRCWYTVEHCSRSRL